MNILFDISHPAHFHLFKNVIKALQRDGYRTLITVRDKDVLIDLLDHEKFDYHSLTRPRQNYAGLFLELMLRNIGMLRLCHHFKPDLLIGTSVNITHVAPLTGKRSIVVNEDDDSVVPLFTYLSYPFAHKIINPSCIQFRHWGNKRVLHKSYHELAYLHPDNFTPDINVLKKYNLTEKKYVIARFSALKAHHDVGATGISESLWFNIEKLLVDYAIVKSFEQKKSHRIEPWDMHHLLAFAKMIISDSQTMTIEGAVLGVPAVRINTFIGKSSVLSELENKYKLAIGILPDREDEIIKSIKAILQNLDIDQLWKVRREKLLSEKEDLNRWIVGFVKEEMGFV